MVLIVIVIDNSYKVLFSNQNETHCNVQPPRDENTYINQNHLEEICKKKIFFTD